MTDVRKATLGPIGHNNVLEASSPSLAPTKRPAPRDKDQFFPVAKIAVGKQPRPAARPAVHRSRTRLPAQLGLQHASFEDASEAQLVQELSAAGRMRVFSAGDQL